MPEPVEELVVDAEAGLREEAAAEAEPGPKEEIEAGAEPGPKEEIEAGAEPGPKEEIEAGTEAEPKGEIEAGTEAELKEEMAAGAEPESIEQTVIEEEAESVMTVEPVAGAESELFMESKAEAEPVMEFTVRPDLGESVSTGADLVAWLETHKNTGGTVKLSDNVVLDNAYSFCPNGANRPSVFVDTGNYTITVTGEVEFLSDNHLIFAGQPDDKGIFYVAEKGILCMEGVVVESSQRAFWQEEGAGLVVSKCPVLGSIHYADTPFVMYYRNSICAVVEKGQTLEDVLPEQISCTVNRQGDVTNSEWVSVSWDLEGTEEQQEKRRRFEVQGSFLHVASAEPARCAVVYNDAPLTFTHVTASASGSLYTFQGGFTVAEEFLPFTVMTEYSFDGENWFLYEEQAVRDTDAGFYIACKLESVSREVCSNIYIRLQWNHDGASYFSNVLCYAVSDLEDAGDIGGNRGGGTSIVNPPDTPQETSSGVFSATGQAADDGQVPDAEPANNGAGQPVQAEPANNGAGQPVQAEPVNNSAGQPVQAESANDGAEQPVQAEPVNNSAGQPVQTESANNGVGQGIRAESANNGAEQGGQAESASIDVEQQLLAETSDTDEKPVLFSNTVSNDKSMNDSAEPFPKSGQTLRTDISRNNIIVIAAGAVALSVATGIAGFCVHSRSGTKR